MDQLTASESGESHDSPRQVQAAVSHALSLDIC